MKKKLVFNSLISTGTFQEFTDKIFELSETKESSYVCFANAHMMVESYKSPEFNKILNNADLAAPDGGPVSKAVKVYHGIKQVRVPGMDLLPVLLDEAEKRNKSVYFFGTTDDLLEIIKEKAAKEFPNLRIAGTFSPPFRKLSEEEENDIIDMIQATNPDLLFVALGCPKQEMWMAAHMGKINACMLGVGQAFRTYAGVEKRLPKWARNLSLEWVYRFYLEPGRLWKRYLVTNSFFIYLFIKHLFSPNKQPAELVYEETKK
ncbi:WecB/TagA/CpsF family glycosyltransferase [Chondrinema litorale]|uniref:WecB/TagA/CpsF family glycosyltransferase n=1 Tax=Chondrinema litorale TaxID=2994555 RepID=UPI002543B0F5|nr:WecB/TagA/CpsF family glycosyltransferase [Chondrinema litorale]UZR92741.1 WecB/TagA/CpsF family glycosyltransferase [Chondrinema litorale]